MSLTPGARRPWIRSVQRTALGATLLLAVSGVVAAPSQATSASAGATRAAGSTSAAADHGTSGRHRSGRPDDGMEVSRSTAAAVQREVDGRIGARAQAYPAGSIAIPVVAHIIKGSKKRAAHMTRAGIDQQIAWMNLAYAGQEAPGVAANTPFRFYLKKVTKTKNQKWYTGKQGNAMKRKLHRGGNTTLNLYFVKFSGGLLGYSTFPWNAHGKTLKLDGTVIDFRSRPGGELPGFNEGDTAVHEVGHWLGLLHTFQDGTAGCGADPGASGDLVVDTPAEVNYSGKTYNEGVDTCTIAVGPAYATKYPADAAKADGPDPIHNFMDYPPDSVMNQFTNGQVERMSAYWAAYR